MRKWRRKPIERLIENMDILENLVENPSKFGYYVLLSRLKSGESKPPTSIELLKFKINMEANIKKISRKIERKLGFQLPDGLKD